MKKLKNEKEIMRVLDELPEIFQTLCVCGDKVTVLGTTFFRKDDNELMQKLSTHGYHIFKHGQELNWLYQELQRKR